MNFLPMKEIKVYLMNSNILVQLNSIDWNFFDKTDKLTNRLHWYPGTFPQEIPSALIQSLTQENDIVFDPYGGIGTTVSEAIRLKRRCIISDINPVGVLSSYISSAFLIGNTEIKKQINSFLDYLLNIIDRKNMALNFQYTDETENIDFDTYFSKIIFPSPNELFSQIHISKPQWTLLEKWIEKQTLIYIKEIYDILVTEKQYIKKLIIFEMLSDVLFSSSSQRRSWGHIADNVYPKEMEKRSRDMFIACNRWINRKAKKLLEIDCDYDYSEKRIIVLLHNWLKDLNISIENFHYDLLLTSPPYANAIDYLKSQKLSLYLFGYTEKDIIHGCNNEIGARTKRNTADSTKTWAENLISALHRQFMPSKEYAFFAFILPSEETGRAVGNEKIKEFFQKNGRYLFFEKERSINQAKTIQSWTSIKKEKILIFSKRN